jgi:thiol:disulfide interchange protein DsbC
MFIRGVVTLLLAGAVMSGQPILAEEPPRRVVEAVGNMVPGATPDRIAATPIPGIFEVAFGPTVIYVSADGQYFFRGDLVEVATRRNLTEAREREGRLAALAALDEGDMIVFGADDAEHTVTVFTDVDCPYCARLHQQMSEYNELGVRIRYLAFPRAGIPSPSYAKTVSVWCSDDPHRAIGDAKLGRPVPERSCENPVRDHFKMGRIVGVRGTPTIILESGELVPGYVPPRQLLRIIEGRSG